MPNEIGTYEDRRPRPWLARESWQASIGSVVCGLLLALPWFDERLYFAAWPGLIGWIAIGWDMPPHIAFRQWLLGGLVTSGAAYHWLPGMAANHLEVSQPTALLVATCIVAWDAFR